MRNTSKSNGITKCHKQYEYDYNYEKYKSLAVENMMMTILEMIFNIEFLCSIIKVYIDSESLVE